ncbi:MAG: DUF1801 domain-containing protein [Dehalococcoidia bacterium]
MANHLRRVVMAAAPEATEHGYPGWRGIGYRHPVAGYFCGIFPLTTGVKLFFEYGRQLADPAHLLQGEGSQTRYVPLREIDAIVEEQIASLVEAAVVFGVVNKGRLSEFRGATRGA